MRNDLIALIGDFDAGVVAHQAINRSFVLANEAGSFHVVPRWIGTASLTPGDGRNFEGVRGIWCVPASPYRSTDGALWAIQYARTRCVPFLGTCGGFQHALLEYARNVLGLKDAAHAELNPAAAFPLLRRLECSLVEKAQRVLITSDHFTAIYGAISGQEDFHCSYGLNPRFEELFATGPLEIVARAEDGEARAIELRPHPFFVGTLFQPERRALAGGLHPVVRAFFAACRGGTAGAADDATDREPVPLSS
jgi:CTP synthase (UTP-ammonia lyase)